MGTATFVLMRRVALIALLAACHGPVHRKEAGQTKSWEVAAAAVALQLTGPDGTCDKTKNADLEVVCTARTAAECATISDANVRAFCNYDCAQIKLDGYRELCGFQGNLETCAGMEKLGEWFAICESGLPKTIHSDGCEAGYQRTDPTAACGPI